LTTYQQTRTRVISVQQGKQRRLFPRLLIYAGLFELLYALIVALSGLPELHLSGTPLVEAWPWLLLPAQILFAPISAASHSALLASALLGAALAGLLGVYACAIVSLLRLRSDHDAARPWLLLLLGGALVFGLTLLFQTRLFSDDVFTYIFSGRILAVYGADPLNTAPFQFPHDPYLPWVLSGRNAPNIYGPLWLCIASLLAGAGAAPPATLLLFKGVALLAHLTSCVLVWAILDKIAPARRLLGTLLYAWNPLALIELAGSGHNEGVLLILLLLATWLFLHEKRYFKISAYIVFGLAISANLLALLVAPLYLWFDVRTEHNVGRACWGFCWRALIMLVPELVVSLPFWRGASTFFAITSAIDMEHFVHSPVGTLAWPIRHAFALVATWGHFPAILEPVTAADVTLRASATFIFILIYTNLFSRARRAPTTVAAMQASPSADPEMNIPGFDVLLSNCAIAVFWYLVLVSGWFWPWYLLWMLWVVVLHRLDAFTSAMLVLSGTALFIYPFVGFARGPIANYSTALIFGIPLVYLIIARSKQRHAERTTSLYE
jgi:hypothetical protein